MHSDTLLVQGFIICAIGGVIYSAMMVVIFIKARTGSKSKFNDPNNRQRDMYWLEDDGRPSRNSPGESTQSHPRNPES